MDVVFDCAGLNDPSYKSVLKTWGNSKYVSMNSPLLSSADKDGLICGMFDAARSLITENMLSISTQGNTHRWGYFMINPTALKTVARYVDEGKVSL